MFGFREFNEEEERDAGAMTRNPQTLNAIAALVTAFANHPAHGGNSSATAKHGDRK